MNMFRRMDGEIPGNGLASVLMSEENGVADIGDETAHDVADIAENVADNRSDVADIGDETPRCWPISTKMLPIIGRKLPIMLPISLICSSLRGNAANAQATLRQARMDLRTGRDEFQ